MTHMDKSELETENETMALALAAIRDAVEDSEISRSEALARIAAVLADTELSWAWVDAENEDDDE
jgi:hypothetical protein